MKKCKQCNREYADETLNFCLDDGKWLIGGDESSTSLFTSEDLKGEPTAGAPINTTDQTVILPGVSLPGNNGRPTSSAEYLVTEVRNHRRGIAAGLSILLIAAAGLGYWFFKIRGTASESASISSVAVLPFQNKSSDASNDYLSDGLAETLIYRLSQIPSLKVSPTSSVMRYKGKDMDLPKIAGELGVDTVMTGRLSQIGDNLTISVELVDTRNNKLIWAEHYDRKMSDLLAIQREIATNITQKLELKLSGSDTKGMTKKYTDNSEAYQLYLKGRFHFAKRTKVDVLQSVEIFRQAITLDPNFALAYVGVADSYGTMSSYGYAAPNDVIPQARAAAQRALEIDPELAEAHASYAGLIGEYDWNLAEAASQYKQSIQLNPNIAYTHYQYGISCLTRSGGFDEAIDELKRALELDPLSVPAQGNLAGAYVLARKYDMAIQQGRQALALEPNHPTARFWLAYAYDASGMYPDAISLCQPTLATDPGNQDCLQVVGYAYALSGRRQEAEQVIKKFEEIGRTQYSVAYRPAVIHALLGDKDKAFAGLEKSFAAHDWDIGLMGVDPFVDSLRGDSRFNDLLKRMNLPE
jgi:Predicted integral membrane protein